MSGDIYLLMQLAPLSHFSHAMNSKQTSCHPKPKKKKHPPFRCLFTILPSQPHSHNHHTLHTHTLAETETEITEPKNLTTLFFSFPKNHHERDSSRSGRPMRQPNRLQVLGGHLRRARHRSHRQAPRRRRRRHLRPPARAHQRLLQRGLRRKVRSPGGPHGSGAWHHGQHQIRTLWQDLPSR